LIAYLEESHNQKWLVILDERGELTYCRQVSDLREKPQGVLAPIVTKEMYDADRYPQRRGGSVTKLHSGLHRPVFQSAFSERRFSG
jgi:hypothetical protein